MLLRSLLSVALILLGVCGQAAAFAGFASPRKAGMVGMPTTMDAKTMVRFENVKVSKLQLWSKKVDDELASSKNKEPIQAPSSSSSVEQKQEQKPLRPKKMPEAMKQVIVALGSAYNLFAIMAGTFFTCGIILNICGYDYRFTDDGFRVDTIHQFRVERQFEMEYKRMSSQTKPPSMLP